MKQVVCMISLVAALSASLFAEEKVADVLAVRIVPTRADDHGKRSITLWQPADHFHVIISNVSKEPIRLWREWCSWGEQMLSFEVTDEKGRTVIVKRTSRNYRKNYADWTLVPPGDHIVFEVSFDQATWANPILPEKGKSRELKLKAVFEIPEDKDTKEQKVWTGKVSSPEQTYTIYR